MPRRYSCIIEFSGKHLSVVLQEFYVAFQVTLMTFPEYFPALHFSLHRFLGSYGGLSFLRSKPNSALKSLKLLFVF